MPSQARARREPQRTCIGCRRSGSKRGFVRIVRTPDGHVLIDPGERLNGRGAYLHEARPCWERALKGGTIGRALRVTPAPSDLEALRAHAEALQHEDSRTYDDQA